MTTVVEYEDLNVGDEIVTVYYAQGAVTTIHGTVTKLGQIDGGQGVTLNDLNAFDVAGAVLVLVSGQPAVPEEEPPYLFVKYPVGTLVRGHFPESELHRNWVAESGGKFRSIATDALYDQSELLVTEVLWIQ